ncbi:hypothetical protein PFDG_03053 [Plasmodium falciparum Dd2]|uniref:Rifin n=1 Tax=Plasmodium falciparum (isolate Dd2) TaxID=57267 RepID=A0A0L7M2E4_PLAF4|nr:hypothetical protein PFDG_03053 [Plasmodium falciparum Dd2]
MKVHYINILLFAVPLNILANTHKKSSITPRHIQTTRLLCECELFAPQNYDNDPEMKRVMQKFHDRTTQRFQEYDERLQEKQQICKDKCDKEIQKIILKDKIEKELNEKFSLLHTDIQSDDIPTCICEKSMADKVEKTCLKCTQNLGGIVAPSSGVLAGIAEGALYAWKPKALAAAIAAALETNAAKISAAANAAGKAAGLDAVIEGIKDVFITDNLTRTTLQSFFISTPYADVSNVIEIITTKKNEFCGLQDTLGTDMCQKIYINLGTRLPNGNPFLTDTTAISLKAQEIVTHAKEAAADANAAESANVTAQLTTEQTTAINTTYMGYQTTIIASIIAIVVIILIMVIIYFILRYRRKKKLKKKLQYIKLLEE